MIVDFSELPSTSKVWIFQSNRSLNDEELESIQHKLADFLSQWTAHGADLKAGFEFRYKRFIIVALDQQQNKATGCSIDALIHFVQALETTLSIDLLDKMNVSYKQGEFIAYKNLVDFVLLFVFEFFPFPESKPLHHSSRFKFQKRSIF